MIKIISEDLEFTVRPESPAYRFLKKFANETVSIVMTDDTTPQAPEMPLEQTDLINESLRALEDLPVPSETLQEKVEYPYLIYANDVVPESWWDELELELVLTTNPKIIVLNQLVNFFGVDSIEMLKHTRGTRQVSVRMEGGNYAARDVVAVRNHNEQLVLIDRDRWYEIPRGGLF